MNVRVQEQISESIRLRTSGVLERLKDADEGYKYGACPVFDRQYQIVYVAQ